MNDKPPFLSPEDIDALRKGILSGYNEVDQQTFIRLCQRSCLDPFAKQILPNFSGKKVLQPYTTHQGLLTVADRTGNYNGCAVQWTDDDGIWRDEWLDMNRQPLAAKCVLYHKQRTHPEVAIATWPAYAAAGPRWQSDGANMLAKCAKDLALRNAFPDQLSGLYAEEELDQLKNEPPAPPPANATTVESTKPLNVDPEKAELQAERKAEVAAGIEDRAKKPPPSNVKYPASALKQEPVDAKDDIPMDEPAELLENSAAAADESWREHLVLSIKKDVRFAGKKVGEINPIDLMKLQTQFIDRIRKSWDDASPEQHADCIAFEAAIAAQKVANLV